MNSPWPCIEAFLDGELTPTLEAELRAWLIADRDHLRVFVRETHLHRSLRTEVLTQKLLPPEAAFGRVDANIDLASSRQDFSGLGESRTQVHTGSKVLSLPPQPRDHRYIRVARKVLALAASIALLIGLAIWLFPAVHNQPRLAIGDGSRVTVERGLQTIQAPDGLNLQPGDLLQVSGSNGAAILYGAEKTTVAFQNNAEVKVLSWAKGKRLELHSGKLEATVARQRPFAPMEIGSRQAEARVLGTRFTLAVDTNATRLEVTEGKVRFSRPGVPPVTVRAGQYAVASINAELAPLPATGRILHEVWTNYPGTFMAAMTSDANVADHPQSSGYVTRFETALTTGTRYGQRIRGYVHPPTTGAYSFSIMAAGRVGESFLFLSRDENPQGRIQIWEDATGPQATGPAPPPLSIPLVAGRKYYIEALHESHTGDGGITVRWQGPARGREIIPGEFLSPFPVKEKKGRR